MLENLVAAEAEIADYAGQWRLSNGTLQRFVEQTNNNRNFRGLGSNAKLGLKLLIMQGRT